MLKILKWETNIVKVEYQLNYIDISQKHILYITIYKLMIQNVKSDK